MTRQLQAERVFGAAALMQAFLAFMFIMFALSGLESAFEYGLAGNRMVYVGVGSFLCGVPTSASAWYLHRRLPNVTVLFLVSWVMIVIAWITLELVSHGKPVWFVFAVASILAFVAVTFNSKIRRARKVLGLSDRNED